jgi:hypothetical protein
MPSQPFRHRRLTFSASVFACTVPGEFHKKCLLPYGYRQEIIKSDYFRN